MSKNNCYEKEWKSIVENSDGSLKKTEVIKALEEYSQLQQDVGEVYTEITNNLLNKHSYSSDTVISVYKDIQARHERERNQEIYRDLSTMLSNTLGGIYESGIDEILKEYLGVLGQV